MPDPTGNTVSLQLDVNSDGKPCVRSTPAEVRWRKRDGRVLSITGDTSNKRPIRVSYDVAAAARIFSSHPGSPFDLNAGDKKEFTLKDPLGVTARGSFVNKSISFARTFRLDHDPKAHCDHHDHVDFHFEC